jgi:hypothetical protein
MKNPTSELVGFFAFTVRKQQPRRLAAFDSAIPGPLIVRDDSSSVGASIRR